MDVEAPPTQPDGTVEDDAHGLVRERERIAVLLHDGPLQDAIAAQQDLEEHADGDPGALDAARDAIAGAIAGMRRLTTELYTGPDPTASVSVAALRAALLRMPGRSALEIEVEIGVDDARLADHDGLAAAAALELVRNVVKHAGARRATAVVARAGDDVRVEVTDDGVGIAAGDAVAAAAAGSIGLRSLARRVERAGGRLWIDAPPDGGTRVWIVLPVA